MAATASTTTTTTSDIMSTLWSAVEIRLRDTEEFQSPPQLRIIRRGDGDPAEQLREAEGAAGAAGCVLLVSAPLAQPAGRTQVNALVRVDVVESPVLNRGVGGTRRRGAAVAECVLARLHNWQPDLIPCGPLTLVASEKPDEGGDMLNRLTFRCAYFI